MKCDRCDKEFKKLEKWAYENVCDSCWLKYEMELNILGR